MCAKALKGPSLARSVPKPQKGTSLARSVLKPLKEPSLARSVLKPFKMGQEGEGEGEGDPRREQPVHLTFWLFHLLNFHPAQDRSYYYSIGPSSDFDSHEQSNHICHCQGG